MVLKTPRAWTLASCQLTSNHYSCKFQRATSPITKEGEVLRHIPKRGLALLFAGLLVATACGGSSLGQGASSTPTQGANSTPTQAANAGPSQVAPSSSCSAPAADATTLKFTSGQTDPDFFFNRMLTEWRGLVLARSNCKLNLQLYFGTITPDETIQLNNVKTGVVDGSITSTSPVANLYAPLGVVDLWFLFSGGYPQLVKLTHSSLADEWKAGVEKSGLKVVTFMYSAFFQIMTNKPVATPDQLAGMKIRSSPNPVAVAYMKALGANPVALNSGEVYSALQTHLLDGAASNWPGMYTYKWYELVKYATVLNAQANIAVLDMNLAKFQSLPKEYQTILTETAETMAPKELAWVQEADDKALQAMKAAGVTAITPTPAQMQQWVDKARAIDPQFYDRFGQNVINQIKAAAN